LVRPLWECFAGEAKLVGQGEFMRKVSYAAAMQSFHLMEAGLGRQADKLSRRGIDKEFIQAFAELQVRAIRLNGEQESLKSRLREKTAELEDVLAQLGRQHSLAKKLVKLDFPRSGWLEFGIQDKR